MGQQEDAHEFLLGVFRELDDKISTGGRLAVKTHGVEIAETTTIV